MFKKGKVLNLLMLDYFHSFGLYFITPQNVKIMIDYTIGDDIVCIRTHSLKIVKEGDLKTCLGLRPAACNCSTFEVNIGIKSKQQIPIGELAICSKCGITHIVQDNTWWLASHLFKKLDTLVETEYNELLETLEKPAFS